MLVDKKAFKKDLIELITSNQMEENMHEKFLKEDLKEIGFTGELKYKSPKTYISEYKGHEFKLVTDYIRHFVKLDDGLVPIEVLKELKDSNEDIIKFLKDTKAERENLRKQDGELVIKEVDGKKEWRKLDKRDFTDGFVYLEVSDYLKGNQPLPIEMNEEYEQDLELLFDVYDYIESLDGVGNVDLRRYYTKNDNEMEQDTLVLEYATLLGSRYEKIRVTIGDNVKKEIFHNGTTKVIHTEKRKGDPLKQIKQYIKGNKGVENVADIPNKEKLEGMLELSGKKNLIDKIRFSSNIEQENIPMGDDNEVGVYLLETDKVGLGVYPNTFSGREKLMSTLYNYPKGVDQEYYESSLWLEFTDEEKSRFRTLWIDEVGDIKLTKREYTNFMNKSHRHEPTVTIYRDYNLGNPRKREGRILYNAIREQLSEEDILRTKKELEVITGMMVTTFKEDVLPLKSYQVVLYNETEDEILEYTSRTRQEIDRLDDVKKSISLLEINYNLGNLRVFVLGGTRNYYVGTLSKENLKEYVILIREAVAEYLGEDVSKVREYVEEQERLLDEEPAEEEPKEKEKEPKEKEPKEKED